MEWLDLSRPDTLSPLNPKIARGTAITCGVPPEVPAFSIHCSRASAMQVLRITVRFHSAHQGCLRLTHHQCRRTADSKKIA